MFWLRGYALFRRVVMLVSLCVWITMVVNMVAHNKLPITKIKKLGVK
jgi:hypothetical protein